MNEGPVVIGVLAAMLAIVWRPAKAHLVAITALAASASLAVSAASALGTAGRGAVGLAVEPLSLLVLVFLVVRRAPRRAVPVVTLAAVAEIALVVSRGGADASVSEGWWGAWLWASSAAMVAGVALAFRRLEARRAAEVRRAQRRELADDLHDFVAHEVTAMVVQAQAAIAVANRRPAQALAAVERIEASGLRALAVLDRTVRGLEVGAGASDLPGCLAALPRLVDRFGATGPQVDYAVEPGLVEVVSSEASRVAYRVVAEALTNVRRHASQGGRVEVDVARTRLGGCHALAVTVRNEGGDTTTSARRTPGRQGGRGGRGLSSLRERVERLGGTFTAGPTDSGWQVAAVLPEQP
jgi:signal transduction histidine kinase